MAKSPLPDSWEVPSLFRLRLGVTAGRQRAMSAEGHLLIILHAPPGEDDLERVGRLFWRNPEGKWRSSGLGEGIVALQTHLREFRDSLRRCEEEEERADSAEDYFHVMRRVTPIHRMVRNMHNALQQAREMVPDDQQIISSRDESENLVRAAELLEADSKGGLEFAIAIRAEEQTRTAHEMSLASHRLNRLAATFFPIATLAGIFGMNLTHGLEQVFEPWLFWGVLVLAVSFGAIMGRVMVRDPEESSPGRGS